MQAAPSHRAVRAATRSTIARIAPLDDQERYTIAWVLQWIDGGFPLWRTAKPATPPVHLVSYAVLVEGSRILLGAHVTSGLWLPSGGHVEPGEEPLAAAQRELYEECGSRAPLLHPEPLFVSRHRVDPEGDHTDVSLWYAFRADGETLSVDAREFAEARWFELDALPDATVPALARFVRKLPR